MRTRDYKAEYERRIASAAKRGLSRSQARGHAKHGEAPARKSKTPSAYDRLEAALKLLRQTGHQARAAREAGVSPERLRRFLRDNALAERHGKRWQFNDNRPRRMTVLSDGEARQLVLRDFDQASINGTHLNAVRSFLRTNDIEFLLPFNGVEVIDAKGKTHALETNPNKLHRLAAAGSEVFEEVYRLIQ